MQDTIRLSSDLGLAVRQARKTRQLTARTVAHNAGRSRDVLHRLERGDDVTVASLLAILGSMGLVLKLEPAGLPTLHEMQQRFANDPDDAA